MAVRITPECKTEAEKLLAYCESRFPVGEGSNRRFSVTGEEYVELVRTWSEGSKSATNAREAAQIHFDKYAAGKSGTLYWRVVPDIAFNGEKYSYYMRLLISDKPTKEL